MMKPDPLIVLGQDVPADTGLVVATASSTSSSNSPKRARRKSTAVRRLEIVQAAVKLFALHGYHGTSVQDICDAAAIGKGSFYHHIHSKEEVLFEIHNIFADPIIALAEELARDDKPAPAMLSDLGRALLRLVTDYNDYVTVFYREFYVLTGRYKDAIIDKRKRFEALVRDMLRRGADEGTLKEVDNVFVNGYLGMLNYSYVWYHPGGRLTPEQVADVFLDALLSGISKAPHQRAG
jgi:AcrR family transcriptional regulator